MKVLKRITVHMKADRIINATERIQWVVEPLEKKCRNIRQIGKNTSAERMRAAC